MSQSSLPRRALLTSTLAAPFVLRAGAGRAAGAVPVKMSLAAPFDGSTAPFFLAEQNGWGHDAGLAPSFDTSGGSGEAVTRVGSGVYDFGIGDINVMLEFNAKNPAQAYRTVYMLYYRSPLCVGTLRKSGITKPKDLAGRKVGGATADGAYRLFPAYAKTTGIDPKAINWDIVGLQLREAVLARGDVEAIRVFDSTMYFGLQKAGIKPEDIRFLYYSDAGMDLYGNGILVSEKMRKGSPDLVKKFVAVTARAWQAAVANPQAAIAALKKQAPLIDEKLELEKLRWLIKNQLVTAESKADGLGGVRSKRLDAEAALVASAYGLPATPKTADLFDASFMPAANWRKLTA